MKNVIFYFDGFNFYNGLRDASIANPVWKNYYWINFIDFCDQFIFEGSQLKAVKYFTSPPMNPHKRSKQAALFSANRILNPDKFIVINGQYQNKMITCGGICKKEFSHLEEKRTDVNIAIHMLMDCMNNEVDTLVLVSADSDQIPTIQAIKTQFPRKNLKVYFPPKRKSADILQHSKPVVFLGTHEEKFKKAMMPSVVDIGGGKTYTKPLDWNP